MKVAYISGQYRSKHGVNGIAENIWKARECAVRWWQKGYAVICPHTNTAFMDGIGTDDMFLNGDLEILKRCDVIVMLEHWSLSQGATKELDLAKQLGLEIVYEED